MFKIFYLDAESDGITNCCKPCYYILPTISTVTVILKVVVNEVIIDRVGAN